MKLYLAHVGFYDSEIGMYELHSNILVIAEDIHDAKLKIKEKDIFITKQMHIDAIQEVLNVDGYAINVIKQDSPHVNNIFDYNAVKNLD